MDRARKPFSGGTSASECVGEREIEMFLAGSIVSETCNHRAKWDDIPVGKLSGLRNASVM